jgi:hypothetical protein
MTRNLLLGSLVLFVSMAGCGAKKDSGPTSNAIYAAARNITPAVRAGSVAASLAPERAPQALVANGMPWYSGNMGGLIFQTLRDYQYPRDEGQVDATNIYKVLFETGNEFERRFGDLSSITQKQVASPFDFGTFTVADTYDKARNAIGGTQTFMAARLAGNARHLLMAQAAGDATWITQGVHDGDSKELELNSIMLVRYSSGSMAGDIYGIRSWIKGNEATHAFTFRFLQFSYNHTGDMHYYYSVIGTGVSQGAGSHFLFRGSSSIDPSPFAAGPQTGSWCFAASDAEPQYQAKFEAFPPAETGGGEVIDAASPCFAYQDGPDGLDAQLAARPLWGAADVTFDPATFTGGGASHLELAF